ncbi:hypothetical protein [Nocardia brasiliensis]|uniref:hypothetical protein n=1 Tax=Nocardia brasiliensis TaxID=37326 RepID=UPI002456541E|nr:hypothetical protein [Nocardia brasiliensis]
MATDESSREFTKAEAKASDAILKELAVANHQAHQRYLVAEIGVLRAAGAEEVKGKQKWSMDFDDALVRVRAIAAEATADSHADKAKLALTILNDAAALVNTTAEAVEEHDKIWENHGRWSRFFLVPDGHIHSSRSCRSLWPRTLLSWLPELSGESEADAVKAHGALLCTFCFPSAPVEWTDGRKELDPDQCPGTTYKTGTFHLTSHTGSGWAYCEVCEQRVSVTSARNLRKHDKPGVVKPIKVGPKGIAMPDGSPLKLGSTQVKTEVSAEREAARAIADLLGYPRHPDAPEWFAFGLRAVEALAAKRGQSVHEVGILVFEKAKTKYRKEFGKKWRG